MKNTLTVYFYKIIILVNFHKTYLAPYMYRTHSQGRSFRPQDTNWKICTSGIQKSWETFHCSIVFPLPFWPQEWGAIIQIRLIRMNTLYTYNRTSSRLWLNMNLLCFIYMSNSISLCGADFISPLLTVTIGHTDLGWRLLEWLVDDETSTGLGGLHSWFWRSFRWSCLKYIRINFSFGPV